MTQFEPIAYASQNPWLFRGTVKDNILFGASFDHERYKNIIDCCALGPDLATFKDNDMKDVGEGGHRLSGGQRQRVALARAVYSHAGTVVLDDVLSGLDATTFDWIVRYCILGPQVEKRTLVLVSNSDRLLERADMVVYMKNGVVSQAARKYPVKGRGANTDGNVFNSLSTAALDSDSGFWEGDSVDENSDTCENNHNAMGDLDNLRGRTGFRYSKLFILGGHSSADRFQWANIFDRSGVARFL